MRPQETIIPGWLSAALFCLALAPASHALTAKIELRNGAPTLMVDGKPERARVFWGHGFGAGGSAAVGNAWTNLRFAFAAPETDDTCTLHLRFGEEAGEVSVDSVRITDETDKRELFVCAFEEEGAFAKQWEYWCKDKKSPEVSIQVQAGKGQQGAGLTVRLGSGGAITGFHIYTKSVALVKDHSISVSLWVKASSPRFFKPELRHAGGSFQIYGGLPGPFGKELRLAAEAGVRLVSFMVPLCWNEPGKEDYAPAISACQKVVSAEPKSLLIPRIDMRAPGWWRAAHPGVNMKFENGKELEQASVASPEYRAEATAALERVIAVLEKRFPNAILGYHPNGQNTGEWFYYDSWGYPLCGYDDATAAAWKLRTGSAVPTPAQRRAADGLLRHPTAQKEILDFETFRQECMADTLLSLAKGIRRAAPGKLSLFFYGYLFEFAGLQNGPANAGHYALGKLLASPDVDVLCSPISYFHRGLGGSTTGMSAIESVGLAGKLWLNEDDTRTHLTREKSFPGWKDGGTNLAQTRALLTRNVASEACRNLAMWWMDLGGSGWFDDPALWADLKRLAPMDQYFLENPTPFRPEIAVVLDERAMRLVAASNAAGFTTKRLVYQGRSNFNLIGAPYGQYLMEDVLAGKVQAKLYVFLDAWALTSAEREKARMAVRGAGAVWCWLPGYVDQGAISTDAVRDLTGFRVSLYPEGGNALVRAGEEARKAGVPDTFGPDAMLRPLLAPQPSPGDQTLATFADGKPAVLLRPNGGGFSVFCSTTELPQGLLRLLARRAGVHLYSETDANICANGPFIVVHACADGPLTLHARGAVRDALSGEKLSAGPSITLPLSFGETRVLRVGK